MRTIATLAVFRVSVAGAACAQIAAERLLGEVAAFGAEQARQAKREPSVGAAAALLRP